MQTKIEATYKVVTPMFCGDASGSGAELRLSSFKGVLRFWWRALAWPRLAGDLGKIKQAEDSLFGSAGGGQSRLVMRLDAPRELGKVKAKEILKVPGTNRVVGEGARYLGYGVMHAFASSRSRVEAGELIKSCIREPFEFTVRMRFRPSSKHERELESLQDALIALGMLGGMGAKSRKGYGSLVLRSLKVSGQEEWTPPQNMSELGSRIREIAAGTNLLAALPEYTALSRGTRHVLLTSNENEAIGLLNLIGREMVRYRSWGFRGKVFGDPSERNFKDDHDLMKNAPHQRQEHPRRIAFGLPHNYGRYPKDQVDPAHRDFGRRASLLFIHMHECRGKPVAVVSFFPARFLPEGKSNISVGGESIRQKQESELYEPLHAFLGRLMTGKNRTNVDVKDRRKETFTDQLDVRYDNAN